MKEEVINLITEVIFTLEVREEKELMMHADRMIQLMNTHHVAELLLKTEGGSFWNMFLKRHMAYLKNLGILVSNYPDAASSEKPLQALLGHYHYARAKHQFSNITKKPADLCGHSFWLIHSLCKSSDFIKAIGSPGATEALFFLQTHFFNVIRHYLSITKGMTDKTAIQEITVNVLYSKLILVASHLSPNIIYAYHSTPGYLIMAEWYIRVGEFLESIASEEVHITQCRQWCFEGLKYLYIAQALIPTTQEAVKRVYGDEAIFSHPQSLDDYIETVGSRCFPAGLFPSLIKEIADEAKEIAASLTEETVRKKESAEQKQPFFSIFSMGLRQPFVNKLRKAISELPETDLEDIRLNLTTLRELRKRQHPQSLTF